MGPQSGFMLDPCISWQEIFSAFCNTRELNCT